jgi:cytochrome c55X
VRGYEYPWQALIILSLTPLIACAQAPVTIQAPVTTQASATTPAPDQATIDAGKKLYTSYCARCHGINMINTGAAFDLRTFPKDGRARFENSVKQGLRAMPAWGESFSALELSALWAYVSQNPESR